MSIQCGQRACVGEWLRVKNGRPHQGLDHRWRALQGDDASPSRNQEQREAARLWMWHLHIPQGLSLLFRSCLSVTFSLDKPPSYLTLDDLFRNGSSINPWDSLVPTQASRSELPRTVPSSPWALTVPIASWVGQTASVSRRVLAPSLPPSPPHRAGIQPSRSKSICTIALSAVLRLGVPLIMASALLNELRIR